MSSIRACAILPTYDNPLTLPAVTEAVRRQVSYVIVVDDGSAPAGREAASALRARGGVQVLRRERNGGKGAAAKEGLRAAQAAGFTHAVLLDADGQHAAEDIPRFLAAAAANPGALIAGRPVFDDTAPWLRRRGRLVTRFWTDLETGGRIIDDALCGFRVYPIEEALQVRCGDRMEFDVEIAVRMAWRGCPVIHVPTRVRYLTKGEGGVSHFRMLRDNLRISWCHTRLCALALARALLPRGTRRAVTARRAAR